ncbi:MAG: hypothetical protein QOD02_2196 [Mycobacterium sp.]|jgi:hypothetical protein|nr:hypothetical protein [Mycobacterium sp.]
MRLLHTPDNPAGRRCRGRVQAGEIGSVPGGCTRSVATFTLRKQLGPSRGFRTKTEPLVTRSLCASKSFSFRMLKIIWEVLFRDSDLLQCELQ